MEVFIASRVRSGSLFLVPVCSFLAFFTPDPSHKLSSLSLVAARRKDDELNARLHELWEKLFERLKTGSLLNVARWGRWKDGGIAFHERQSIVNERSLIRGKGWGCNEIVGGSESIEPVYFSSRLRRVMQRIQLQTGHRWLRLITEPQLLVSRCPLYS